MGGPHMTKEPISLARSIETNTANWSFCHDKHHQDLHTKCSDFQDHFTQDSYAKAALARNDLVNYCLDASERPSTSRPASEGYYGPLGNFQTPPATPSRDSRSGKYDIDTDDDVMLLLPYRMRAQDDTVDAPSVKINDRQGPLHKFDRNNMGLPQVAGKPALFRHTRINILDVTWQLCQIFQKLITRSPYVGDFVSSAHHHALSAMMPMLFLPNYSEVGIFRGI